MAVQYSFVVKGLTKAFPGARKPVLDNVNLQFPPGAKIAVIGMNGAGKSTLLKTMAGLDDDFQGEAWAGEGVTLGYLPQEPQLDRSRTVKENVMDGVRPVADLLARFNAISGELAEPTEATDFDALMAEMGELEGQIEAVDGWTLDNQLEIALEALGCPPGDCPTANLSGGEFRRIALTRLLLEEPDVLLLDEPTNHLDAGSVAWLENHLAGYQGSVVLVTHDRYFLDSIVSGVIELDRGRSYSHDTGYSGFLAARAERVAQEERETEGRKRAIREELRWLRQSTKVRQNRSKARLKAFDALLERHAARTPTKAQIVLPVPERLGSHVVQVTGLTKSFGGAQLFDGLGFTVPRGAIVGVIGPNGTGKTTLFRLIAGEETPDAGTIRIGETVRLGYVDQLRASLDPAQTVWEAISSGEERFGFGPFEVLSRAYVAGFGFHGTDQQKKVGAISGGERNRVHLARMLAQGANVLLLDEPTNDLDLETLRALEEALESFAGCAMVITHDRFFLDRLATHILAFEGGGHVEWLEGNFEAYKEDRQRRLGEAADRPVKGLHRRLTR